MTLDPDSADTVVAMKAAGFDGFAKLDLGRARTMVDRNRTFFHGAELPSVDDLAIGPLGVPCRVYRPDSGETPAIVFLHGGGWVLGSLDSHDAVCRELSRTSGATVVAVAYRLAPEHPFPAAVDDAWSVLRWVLEHGADLSIDMTRVAVAGDSAGGNLAAVVARLARDEGFRLALQVLIYPVIDRRLDRPSMIENATGYVLERDDMAWFWDHYDPAGSAMSDPRAVPYLASLEGLADALIITAEHDPLRDEGEEYAERLAAAGVSTRLRRYDGTFHGFMAGPGFTPVGDAALREIGDALALALAAGGNDPG